LIVFDFEEALSFEGETGPYLQYSCVRLNSIFRKLKEREGTSEEDILKSGKTGFSLDPLTEKEAGDFWDLILDAAQLEGEVIHSTASLEFAHLAKFAFNLCQKFNSYYHLYPILNEENKDVKIIRLLTIRYIKEQLQNALALMGIPLPERM
jgi:arginyl-tRNA synthetase